MVFVKRSFGLRSMLSVFALASAVLGHDVPALTADLVVRKTGRVEVRVVAPLLEELHRTLAPKQNLTDFLIGYAALDTITLAESLGKLESRWERAIRVEMDPASVSLRWIWPSATLVHSQLAEALNDVLVVGEADLILPVLELRATGQLRGKLGKRLELALPPGLGLQGVAVYGPDQELLAPAWR